MGIMPQPEKYQVLIERVMTGGAPNLVSGGGRDLLTAALRVGGG